MFFLKPTGIDMNIDQDELAKIIEDASVVSFEEEVACLQDTIRLYLASINLVTMKNLKEIRSLDRNTCIVLYETLGSYTECSVSKESIDQDCFDALIQAAKKISNFLYKHNFPDYERNKKLPDYTRCAFFLDLLATVGLLNTNSLTLCNENWETIDEKLSTDTAKIDDENDANDAIEYVENMLNELSSQRFRP